MKSKGFFAILKRLSMKQITETFLEGQSLTLSWIKIANLSCQGLQQKELPERKLLYKVRKVVKTSKKKLW